jgi:hypothetical protein
MAGFFQKVTWTECTGEMNRDCARFVNKERLPAYKSRCSDCGSKAREVTVPDWLKIGIAAGLCVLLAGGGGWYAWSQNGLVQGAGHVSPTPPGGGPVSAPEAVSWSLATENGDLAPQDFDASGTTYTSRRSFTAGDRLRLEVSYKSGKLYSFYRSASEGKALGQGTSGRTTLPSSNQWFQLDDHTGTEEFILVATDQSLPDLDGMRQNVDPNTLDQTIRKLDSSKRASVTRILVPHR